MLFSAANVFYGLTPNGFKAWKVGHGCLFLILFLIL